MKFVDVIMLLLYWMMELNFFFLASIKEFSVVCLFVLLIWLTWGLQFSIEYHPNATRLTNFPRFRHWIELGPVSTHDNRVLNGPLGRSLRSFARTAHSAHSLRSAPLRYARFARSLRSRARSLTSLTPSWDSGNTWICVHAVNVFHGFKHVFPLH